MDVQLPDGTTIQGIPDGTSKADLVAKLKANGYDTSKLEAPAPAQPPGFGERLLSSAIMGPLGASMSLRKVGNTLAGAVQGAGDLGATYLWPVDKTTDLVKGDRGPTLSGLVTGQQPVSRNQERRQDMTAGLTTLGADPTAAEFSLGRLAGQIAGTAGVGPAFGLAARGLGLSPALVSALTTSGFRAGPAAPGAAGAAANLLLRSAAGATTGGATVGLVDPEHAGTGALIGGVLPGAARIAGGVGGMLSDGAQSAARYLMQSALKPTLAERRSGDAAAAVQTLLDNGLNATKGGAASLRDMVSQKNDEIRSIIANSSAVIPKADVVPALTSTRTAFGNQVSPAGDLAAIDAVEQGFLAHPNQPGPTLPIQAAQDLKTGTYRVLDGKYGEMGSAQTEAQKALARGLKEQIAAAEPTVGSLNADESNLLRALGVVDRSSQLAGNKNPLGLSALRMTNPVEAASFLMDRSALIKSLLARGLNAASEGAPQLTTTLAPQAYRSAPRTGNNLQNQPYGVNPLLLLTATQSQR